MRARGRGMTWWARTAQKSGSRLLPNAAVPVWLSSACKKRAMAPDEKLAVGAPCGHRSPPPALLPLAPLPSQGPWLCMSRHVRLMSMCVA